MSGWRATQRVGLIFLLSPLMASHLPAESQTRPAGQLGKVGLACKRTVDAANAALASGQTKAGSFEIQWKTIPSPGAKTEIMCNCVERAFRQAGTARSNILSLGLVPSNRGELLSTEVIQTRIFDLLPGGRYGGREARFGYHNAGDEPRETLIGYARFLDQVARCGEAVAGPKYNNTLFRDVRTFRGVTLAR